MSNYAETKIKEALKLCGGNMKQARQQIMLLAQSDDALLASLTRPHLDGIVAYQVERVASGRADSEALAAPISNETPQKESFGMELLRAVASSEVTVFGLESGEPLGKRKGASQQHIEAIHKMALARRNKNK